MNEDISKTNELWTIFDGFSIPWYYIDNTDSFIEIKDVPTKESKNMLHQNLEEDTDTDTSVQVIGILSSQSNQENIS